jgi:hypothetical protein
LIEAGATIAEACQAVEISRQTLYRRARSHAAFAELLRAAREQMRPTADDPFAQFDWREAAKQLEAEHPENWKLSDPFDFDPLA